MKTLPNRILFEEARAVLQKGGTVKLRLVGNSMYPFLRNGRDTVVIGPVATETLHQGAVVLFRYGEHYLLHRIIGHRNGQYLLQGDGNYATTESASAENILGILTRIEYPGGRVWNCTSFSWRCYSRLWRLLRPLRPWLLRLFHLFSG